MYEDDKVASLIHLYEDGALSRRELIRRLAKHTGSVATATAAVASAGLLEAQTPACPADVRVPENAPDIGTQLVTLYGEGGPLFAYMTTPRNATLPRPAVLVIHENRGLNDHIKDVTRRVARAGFIGLGIDLLSRQGGTDAFPDPEQAGAAYNRTRPEERRQDLLSALLTLRDQPYVQGGRVGAVGFCAGGGNCFDLALNTDALSAAVVFYGAPLPAPEQVGPLNAPLLGIFAELDRGVNARLPAVLTTFNDQRKTFGLHVYENTNHAFHNDTGPRYDRAASCDAWAKTIDFFNRHLNRPAA